MGYPHEEDAFIVQKEPEVTTSVIPFAKEDVRGRSVHVLFYVDKSQQNEDNDEGKEGNEEELDVEGTKCEVETEKKMMKGVISWVRGTTMHIKFFDGDKVTVDISTDEDVLLWENGDVTKKATWPTSSKGSKRKIGNQAKDSKEKEQVSAQHGDEMNEDKKMVTVAQGQDLAQLPVSQNKKGGKEVDTLASRDTGDSKIVSHDTKQKNIKRPEGLGDGQRIEKMETKKTLKSPQFEKSKAKDPTVQSTGKSSTEIESRKRKITNNPQSPVDKRQKALLPGQEKPITGAQKTPISKSLVQLEKDNPLAVLQQHFNNTGKKLLDTFKLLENSMTSVSALTRQLKEISEHGSPHLKDSSVIKTARGILKRFLKPPRPGSSDDAGELVKVWPLDETIMNALGELHDVIESIQGKPLWMNDSSEPLLFWRKLKGIDGLTASRQEPPMSSVKSPSQPAGIQEPSCSQKRQITPINQRTPKPPTALGKAGQQHKLIQSMPKSKPEELAYIVKTSDPRRNDSINILAHALLSNHSPFEVAVDVEAVLKKEFDGESSDKYLVAVETVWKLLSPESEKCRPLLRIMVQEGVITPQDLVKLSGKELEEEEERFYTRLKSRDWLEEAFSKKSQQSLT